MGQLKADRKGRHALDPWTNRRSGFRMSIESSNVRLSASPVRFSRPEECSVPARLHRRTRVRCRHPALAGGLDQVFDEIGEGHDVRLAEASMLTRTKLGVAHAAMGHDTPTSQDPNTGNGGDLNNIAVVRNGSCTNGDSAMFGRPAATGTMSPSGMASSIARRLAGQRFVRIDETRQRARRDRRVPCASRRHR